MVSQINGNQKQATNKNQGPLQQLFTFLSLEKIKMATIKESHVQTVANQIKTTPRKVCGGRCTVKVITQQRSTPDQTRTAGSLPDTRAAPTFVFSFFSIIGHVITINPPLFRVSSHSFFFSFFLAVVKERKKPETTGMKEESSRESLIDRRRQWSQKKKKGGNDDDDDYYNKHGRRVL